MAGCWYIMGSLWLSVLLDPRAFGYVGGCCPGPRAQFSCLWLQERVPTSHCGALTTIGATAGYCGES